MIKSLLCIIFFVCALSAVAQNDTLVLKNDDLMVGEIKSMDKGILTIETDYSDVDFKVSWSGIKRVRTNRYYLITLSDGRRFNGSFKSLDDEKVEIDTELPVLLIKFSNKTSKTEKPFVGKVIVPTMDMVYLAALDEGFWSRLSANIDFGWSLTKANNLRQVSFTSGLGYLADRWKISSSINAMNSTQDEVEPTKRIDGSVDFNYFLPNDWYALYNLGFLSNTEQKIKLRVNNMIGMGKYIVHTNKTYLGAAAGLNLNTEEFLDEENSANSSAEAFIGGQYNIYDIGDLDLLTSVTAYPSLTESKRFRTDFKFDIRYEFKFDVYFKISTTVNYDSNPTEGASSLDYIFQTNIGWKL
jgi:hypothetical protein